MELDPKAVVRVLKLAQNETEREDVPPSLRATVHELVEMELVDLVQRWVAGRSATYLLLPRAGQVALDLALRRV